MCEQYNDFDIICLEFNRLPNVTIRENLLAWIYLVQLDRKWKWVALNAFFQEQSIRYQCQLNSLLQKKIYSIKSSLALKIVYQNQNFKYSACLTIISKESSKNSISEILYTSFSFNKEIMSRIHLYLI